MPKRKPKAVRSSPRVKAKAAAKRSAPKPKKPAAKKKSAAKKIARTPSVKLDGRVVAAVALAIEAELAAQAAPAVGAPSAWLLSARPRRTHTR